MRSFYRIAGYLLEMIFDASSLDSENPETFPGFTPFSSDKEPAEEKPLLRFFTGIPLSDWTVEPQYRSTFEEYAVDFSKDRNTYLFRLALPESDAPWLMEIHREGETFQAFSNMNPSTPKYVLKFSVWVAFSLAALSRQIVSIHASTVMYQGKSTLFLGESGTGKSTHTRLWLNYIPGAELLNDDSPFVRVEAGGNVRVYGSPWSGKTPCYKNLHTPIAAFVRLSQAPCNRIRRLTGIKAIGALLPSCPLIFTYDQPLLESIYSVLSGALLQAPVYHLECLPDPDAARLVFETLREEGRL